MQILVWKGILSIQQVCNFFSYFSALLLTMMIKWEKRNSLTWSTKLNYVITFSKRDSVNTVIDVNICIKLSHLKTNQRQEATVKNHTVQKAQVKINHDNHHLIKTEHNLNTKTAIKWWVTKASTSSKCNS